MMPRNAINSFLAAAALLAVLAPPAHGVGGGGAVANVPPTIESLVVTIDDGGGCKASTIADRGGLDRVRVTGTVRDANGEADLVGLRVLVRGATNLTYEIRETNTRWDVGTGTIDTTPDEERDASSPDSGGSRRMNVWDDTGATNDGLARFNLVLVISSGDDVGVWSFAAEAMDEASTWSAGPAGSVTALVARQEVTVDLAPVDDEGVSQAVAWGDWSAPPGATGVAARNNLRIRNTGDCPAPEVALSWDGVALTGYGRPSATIPLMDNIAYQTAAEPLGGSPPSFGPAKAGLGLDAGTTMVMPGPGNGIWVRFTLLQLPAVADDLSYRQTLTVTCLDDACDTVFV